jgi:molybdopterin molybdotransferase
VGEEDHVKAQIEARGRLNLWKLAIKPGKPLAFGEVQNCPIFGLPGNPVSAWVTFALVVKPWLLRAQGARGLKSAKIVAQAQFEVTRPGSRQEYLRVNLKRDRCTGSGLSTVKAVPTRDQSSGVLSGVSEADALAVVPLGTTIAMGDPIEVLPISDLLSPLSVESPDSN